MAKGQKTGGRKAGTPNKTTAVIKQAFVDAFEKRGGTTALITWAASNETEFYKLVAKLFPVELTGANGGPIETKDVSARETLARRISGIAGRQTAGKGDRKP